MWKWIGVPAFIANIIVAATNITKIHNKTGGCAINQSIFSKMYMILPLQLFCTNSLGREALLNGKAQYRLHPCTNSLDQLFLNLKY